MSRSSRNRGQGSIKSRTTKTGALHIEVLQNGSSITSAEIAIKRSGKIQITSEKEGLLSLPYYPLPEGKLDIAQWQRRTVVLDLNPEWQGFCTSMGTGVVIEKGRVLKSPVSLHHGDFASLSYGDLRIMLRIGAASKPIKTHSNWVVAAYRGSLLKLLMPTILEWQISAIAALMAAVVIGSASVGLLNRPVQRPRQLTEIDDEYVLHFISPNNLVHAPEALQKNLRRSSMLRQVMEYYNSLTSSMMGWPIENEKLLPPTTLGMNKALQESGQAIAAAKKRRQLEIDKLQLMKNGSSVISIPSVIGESVTTSMLRIQDKIAVGHLSFDANLAAKRKMQQIFPHDPDYAWEEYRNVSSVDPLSEATGRIKPFEILSEEELVYRDAKQFAVNARRKQKPLVDVMEPGEYITAEADQPVSMPDGVQFVSFATATDPYIADEKLNQLQAPEYGQQDQVVKAKVVPTKEPLVGEIEPSLIVGHIQKNRFELQLCYELALRRNEQVAGTMEWRWRIDSRGGISDIALISTSIKDPRMTDCIRKKIGAWRFPRPRNGSVEVSYPFEFAPTKG
ncbi:MAG: AgmX/PglI C-terminal domain-containing protein [Deltaproteobacteria bacterium]|nr:AgmX/PglI C-terminal domain-containing protein [Deltaproteobacteria bacterium]